MTDADKERSPKDESKRLLKVAATHKEFYVRTAVRAARTRAAHLLLRMPPGHSRCASIASPAQRGSTHRYPRYCTATWESR